MFQKIRNAFKKSVRKAYVQFQSLCAQAAQASSGEMYVDTAAKVLIACVIGMLILVSFYALFKTNIIPSVTKQITEMFSYSA